MVENDESKRMTHLDVGESDSKGSRLFGDIDCFKLCFYSLVEGVAPRLRIAL